MITSMFRWYSDFFLYTIRTNDTEQVFLTYTFFVFVVRLMCVSYFPEQCALNGLRQDVFRCIFLVSQSVLKEHFGLDGYMIFLLN